jgi:UDP-glucose 4-epimerase
MKKILITGANSYVGTNVERWLMKQPERYYVETLDLKNPNWNEYDFSKFDVVFHVAGIAHVSTKKSMKDLYFKVNCDLAFDVANRAKTFNVKQFIFMSSMIVYSSKESRITIDTIPNPDNFYGLSKLEAEKKILELKDKFFNICILRPPMIYGINSKGNFSKLLKTSKKLFIIPKTSNSRSFLYIKNLSEFIKIVIDNGLIGTFFPQNKDYFSTSDLIVKIRKEYKIKTKVINIFPIFFKKICKNLPFLNRVFGDYFYDSNLGNYSFDYQLYDSSDSIKEIISNE